MTKDRWIHDRIYSGRPEPEHPYVLRPCSSIEPGDGLDLGSSLEERFAKLTQELPLVGAAGMVTHADGLGLAMIETIREAAPWYGPALDVIGRQLAFNLWAGRPWLAWRPLCLVGPPGVGKTHLTSSMMKSPFSEAMMSTGVG